MTHLSTSFLIFEKRYNDSHEIACPFLLFLKKQQNLKLSSAANYGALLVNQGHYFLFFTATHFGTQFLKVVAFIVGSSPSVEQTLTDLK